MKCKRKMQKRRDILTILGMLVLLTFILRMWPILLLMLIGVFFYAMWLLFHMGEKPKQTETTPRLALPAPSSEESVLNMAFSVLQRRITEQVLFRYAEFDTIDRDDRYRMMDISARCSNRDGAALRFVAERLVHRPEDIAVKNVKTKGDQKNYGEILL